MGVDQLRGMNAAAKNEVLPGTLSAPAWQRLKWLSVAVLCL